MAVATQVTLDEYLSHSYEPDREYAGGRLIERNLGTRKDSFLQLSIAIALRAQGLRTYPELRFQVRNDRFRIPDVLALAAGQKLRGDYLTDTPFIVVEIVSPDDRISDMNEKLQDYLDARVPNVWVVDPATQVLTVHERGQTRTITDFVRTADGSISLDVADLFRQMVEDAAN
jgi:Uma2 family endonuclease